MREGFAIRIKIRIEESKTLLSLKIIFQQFLVDVFTILELERLKWLKNNQTKLKVSKYKTINEEGDQSQTHRSSM